MMHLPNPNKSLGRASSKHWLNSFTLIISVSVNNCLLFSLIDFMHVSHLIAIKWQ